MRYYTPMYTAISFLMFLGNCMRAEASNRLMITSPAPVLQITDRPGPAVFSLDYDGSAGPIIIRELDAFLISLESLNQMQWLGLVSAFDSYWRGMSEEPLDFHHHGDTIEGVQRTAPDAYFHTTFFGFSVDEVQTQTPGLHAGWFQPTPTARPLPQSNEYAIALHNLERFDLNTIPPEFCCHFSGEIMKDPVIDPTMLNDDALLWLDSPIDKKPDNRGNLDEVSRFERAWLEPAIADQGGKSSMTRMPVEIPLIDDKKMRDEIREYYQTQISRSSGLSL